MEEKAKEMGMKLEILVGMIACGKSTYAEKRAKEGAVVVNMDSLILALHGGDYTMYDSMLKPLYWALEQQAILVALIAGKDVVIDRTNLTRDRRQRYIQLAKAAKADVICRRFMIVDPKIHAQRRWDAGARGVSLEQWTKVAEGHMAEYEEPTIDEGFLDIVIAS